MPFYLPNILLAIPRNPVTAVGLPLALGCLSGVPASKVENSNWYYVCLIFCDPDRLLSIRLGLKSTSWKVFS
jgi:hypothetical protein